MPRTVDDVRTAIAIAGESKAPLLARGGGTSQCGQTTGAALVIDHSKYLRRILDVNDQAMTAEVEPGLVYDHLNAALKSKGLWFPVNVSTGAQATLGGIPAHGVLLRVLRRRKSSRGDRCSRVRRGADQRQSKKPDSPFGSS